MKSKAKHYRLLSVSWLDGERMITERAVPCHGCLRNMKMETTSNGGIGKAFGRAVGGGKCSRISTLQRTVTA